MIDVMREQWAASPDSSGLAVRSRFFWASLPTGDETRGKESAVLGPGDVPIYDAEVVSRSSRKSGSKQISKHPWEHDLIGANARARPH